MGYGALIEAALLVILLLNSFWFIRGMRPYNARTTINNRHKIQITKTSHKIKYHLSFNGVFSKICLTGVWLNSFIVLLISLFQDIPRKRSANIQKPSIKKIHISEIPESTDTPKTIVNNAKTFPLTEGFLTLISPIGR